MSNLPYNYLALIQLTQVYSLRKHYLYLVLAFYVLPLYTEWYVLYGNIDQTLVNWLHGLLNFKKGGLDCPVITTVYISRVHWIHMYHLFCNLFRSFRSIFVYNICLQKPLDVLINYKQSFLWGPLILLTFLTDLITFFHLKLLVALQKYGGLISLKVAVFWCVLKFPFWGRSLYVISTINNTFAGIKLKYW